MTVLLADIGGTNTRCALGSAPGGIGNLIGYRNDDFGSLEEVLAGYLAALPASSRPAAAVLAIAAPIHGDDVRMINRDWAFSRPELRRRLRLASLEVLNDFAALAWSLPVLEPRDLVPVGGGSPVPDGVKVVLGPGTGLGVASLIAGAGGWQAVPGEGGHVTVPAQDPQEEAVIRMARERFGHCSAERLLSGSGLSFLHLALHGGPEISPEKIGRLLEAGDAQGVATFGMFFRLLGTVASNAALMLGAFGGVYIGGGIVPRYIDVFRRSGFREQFEAKGRYRDYLRAIPTWAVTSAYPALTGLQAYAKARRIV